MTNILFITPPFFDFWVSYPYLSNPLLSGQLSTAGHSCTSIDLSLMFSRDVLNRNNIENTRKKILDIHNRNTNINEENLNYKKE